MLNELLHEIVARLPHASEASAAEVHAMVDAAVPADTPDTPDADTPDTGTPDTPAKAK